MKMPKRSIGARVTVEVHAALKRQAAADNISVNRLCERIIREHLSLRQTGHSALDLAGFMHEMEMVLDRNEAKARMEMAQFEKWVERNLLSVRAMLDSHVKTALGTTGYDAYVKEVEKIMEVVRSKRAVNGQPN